MYSKIFTLSVVTFQLSLFVSCFDYDKPQILSQYETIVDSKDNFTVICQGNVPLTWIWPEVKDNNDSVWTKVTAIPVLPKNGSYIYASRLFVQNASYPYTGFYKCLGTTVDPSDDDSVSSIYLYVRDKEHLSVSNTPVDTILVTQYSEAILPCRPTSPDVNVKLTLILEEKKDNAIFDPKTGFRFMANHISDEDVYCCEFKYQDLESGYCIYVKIVPMTQSVPIPILEEITGGHTVIGQKLILECKVKSQTYVTLNWHTPSGPPNLKRTSLSNQSKSSLSFISQRLTINKTTLEDKGMYYCMVYDNQNHSNNNSLNVTIYAPNEHFINITEDNNVFQISERAGAHFAVWRLNVIGHPHPTLFWINNENNTITNDNKYEIKHTNNEAILKINDISITDYGNYTLVAENGFETKYFSLFLNVTDKPSVQLKKENFQMINTKSEIPCVVAGHPQPSIKWFFQTCNDENCSREVLNETRAEFKGLQITSYVQINAEKSGNLTCVAENSLGTDEAVQDFYITDVNDGFDIFGINEDINVNTRKSLIEVGEEEDLKIVCGASVFKFKEPIWLKDGKEIENNDRYTLDKSGTQYTSRTVLNLEKANHTDNGSYSCLAKSSDMLNFYKNFTLIVSPISKPKVVYTNLVGDLSITLPNHLKLFCHLKGVPKPKIRWYKNNAIVYPSNKTIFSNMNQNVTFTFLDFKDEGTYKCEATNKAGRVSREVRVKFKNAHESPLILWIIIAALTVGLCIAVLLVIVKWRKQRKLQRELQISGLANFEKGALESLNPDLAIDDQAELLPYDKKWEFPIEKLKLGKQLGSGAFGVVMKGEAKGIVENEECTIVAVKMVKKNADHTYIKALASELKIMVHLGQHLNVVNLLGACTKNVVKRELLVIVEFCRFGNLQNYLLRHRNNFIDQVDPKTHHIDYTIGLEDLERSYSISSSRSATSPYMKYAALSFSNNSDQMADYRGGNYNGATTAKTDITTVSMSPNSAGDEEIILSTNSSMQPEWRSNYRGDYKGNIKPICTKDLLAWAFQVSRGMEYLASRRVLHGDLAARNILLADNNVVKICDFGLAKSMYKSDNYKKKGDGPLPIKWMAIESIRDKIFSTQSDVWSFGIVLWEFFSLARTPYPGMEADERLYNKLLDGYRMESPDHSPREIYKMMLDCWHSKPLSRPTFGKLSERIGSLLEDTVRKHYIDLNDPYLVMNTQRLEDGHSDYLAMLSPPNFENLSSPHDYMNNVTPPESEGYLSMNSSQIFSPRADDERVFSFDLNKKKEKNSEDGTRTELAPMLRSNSADSENESSSPIPLNSFSNPSYQLPPIVEKEFTKTDKDNYVNLPQNKIDGNPFLSRKEKSVKDYVNSTSRDWETVKL